MVCFLGGPVWSQVLDLMILTGPSNSRYSTVLLKIYGKKKKCNLSPVIKALFIPVEAELLLLAVFCRQSLSTSFTPKNISKDF